MKPKIERIKVDVDSLNKELRLKCSDKKRSQIIRKYAQGVCLCCYNVPTRKVSYDLDGVILVERYCDQCFNSRKDGRSKQILHGLT